MTNRIKILIIEDEKPISNFIEAALKSNGYSALIAQTGQEGLSMISSHIPDVILLDLGLPDLDGISVLTHLRSWSNTPVIIISARTNEKEKVAALDSGADDYITKPFGTWELLARIRTALRHNQSGGILQDEKITIRDLSIDFSKYITSIGEREIHLTKMEFGIVSLLAKNRGRVMTYDQIITQLWGPYAMKDNQILRVNMANIRRKIEENPAEPKYIHTEVGIGYRMIEE